MNYFRLGFMVLAVANTSLEAKAEQYVSVQLGQSTVKAVDEVCDYVDATAALFDLSKSCDKKSTGYRLAYGRAFSESFFLEAGYGDFGSLDAKLSDGVNYEKFSFEGTAFDVLAVGKFKLIDTLKFVVRGGLVFWDVDASYSNSFGDLPIEESESGNSMQLGFGFEVNNLSLSLDRINDVGDEDSVGEGDIQRISMGYNFQF